MNKEEIIKKFYDEGILLSPKMLKKITANNVDEFLESAKKTGVAVFQQEEIDSKLNIDVEKIVLKKTLEVNDFIKFYTDKYNRLRDVLTKKVNPVSINKAVKMNSDVSIIGMVREVTENGFLIEDQTGSFEVLSKEKTIKNRDVVAVKGFIREGKLIARELVFPDISLSRKIGKIDNVKILFSKKITREAKKELAEYNAMFLLDQESDEKKIISDLPNPAHITISKVDEKVQILIWKPSDKIKNTDVILWFKKRHLPYFKKQIRFSKDYFLIDPVPDIFCIIGNEEWKKIYKGVSIFSIKDSLVKVDLDSKRIIFNQ